MKSLKESIFDDVESIASDDTVLIEQFLKDNYIIEGTYKIDASYTIKDNTVDVKGHVIVKNEKIESLTNGLFRFGMVSGNFYCTGCPKLKTLEGAPKKVGLDFYCYDCSNLVSLKGAPELVIGDFDCDECENLKDLKGAPELVGGRFDCTKCVGLKSLEGAPRKVALSFVCVDCPNLKSLKGAPKEVGWSLDCRNCKNLKITDQDRKKYKILA